MRTVTGVRAFFCYASRLFVMTVAAVVRSLACGRLTGRQVQTHVHRMRSVTCATDSMPLIEQCSSKDYFVVFRFTIRLRVS